MPARFQEKFSVVQAKSGESAKLECNATGDQPLTVNWFKEDSKLSKRGGENYEIYETMTNGGVNSVLVIRTVGRADGLTYKCIGENEYGNDERLIKLLVVEVPSRPMNVRVKDAWSRSASMVWSSPFAGNSPITSYTIQYWRKNSNEAGQSGQNHRRQEFTVSGTQTSALITNLSPSLTYEASVIAENQVGKSEPSENVAINTGEDEPTAAPSDVTVEARGPSTIRVTWKVPPSETWNGKLLGFYIGFRPRGPVNTIEVGQINGGNAGSTSGAFSYRTIDYIKSQQVFETFLTNLMRGHEYEVVVKAFNTVGSGPESHLMAVRTFDGDLPASPSLFAHQTTHSSISLRWTYPSKAQSSSNPVKRYVLYYQRQGDDSWLEIGIPVEEKMVSHRQSNLNGQQEGHGQQIYSISEATGTTSYQLASLDSGFTYKIYVVAVNNFGMGDPSNIVTTKTEQVGGMTDGLRSGLNPADFNLFEMNKQIQFFMIVPVICTIVLVVAIVSAVFYCTRRMQNPTAQHVITSQTHGNNGPQPTGTWGPEGSIQVGHRYVEFDKGGILKTNGSLLTGTQGSDQNSSNGHPGAQHYPLPYGTMPMNSVVITDQKSWDRQSNAPLKPLVTHIYDSPI